MPKKQKEKAQSSLKTDSQILCLFPSLDYNRTNVHANSKDRMRNLLAVLSLVAERGSVTKYELTNWKSCDNNGFPRLGGQTAQDILVELEELEMLRSLKTTNKKGVPKIERVLTAKGILACLAMPEFQKTEKLAKILHGPNLKESKLATQLRIYNEGYVRRYMDINRKEHSALAVLLREFGEKGFNLELKTQEAIMKDLRKTEDEGFGDMTKLSLADWAGVLMDFISSTDEESQKEKKDLIFLLNSSLNKKPQSEKIDAQQGTKFMQGLMNIASPEFLAWRLAHKRKSVNVDWDTLYKGFMADVDKKLDEWKVNTVKDIGQRCDYISKAMQEVAFDHLQKMDSW